MPSLDDKRHEAVEAVNQLTTLLARCEEFYWASVLYPIKDALENWDLDEAVTMYRAIPMTGMGGFPDLVLSELNGHIVRDYYDDNAVLKSLTASLRQAMAALDACVQHGEEPPLG